MNPTNIEPAAFTVPEAVLFARVTRTSLYVAIKAGELQARKCGRRTLILRDELQRWLQQLPVANSKAA